MILKRIGGKPQKKATEVRVIEELQMFTALHLKVVLPVPEETGGRIGRRMETHILNGKNTLEVSYFLSDWVMVQEHGRL